MVTFSCLRQTKLTARKKEQGQLPVQHLKQRSPLALNPSRQRPSLHVVIPGADHFKPWLSSGLLCHSPLVRLPDLPLLNSVDISLSQR